jgi:hypothetical protein
MRHTLIILLFASTYSNAQEIDYTKISEAQSIRQGATLVRHFNLYGEPCAYFQIIDSTNKWSISETKKFCHIDGKSFLTDFADAEITNIRLTEKGISISLSITPLETTGEQKKECFMPILNDSLGIIECESTR